MGVKVQKQNRETILQVKKEKRKKIHPEIQTHPIPLSDTGLYSGDAWAP